MEEATSLTSRKEKLQPKESQFVIERYCKYLCSYFKFAISFKISPEKKEMMEIETKIVEVTKVGIFVTKPVDRYSA